MQDSNLGRHWSASPTERRSGIIKPCSETKNEEESYHREQPPHRVGRLRSHAYPVLGPQHVELDVLVQLAGIVVEILLRDRVVGTDHFDGPAVACGPARGATVSASKGFIRASASSFGLLLRALVAWAERASNWGESAGDVPRVGNNDIVKWRIGAPEARESDLDYHRVCGMAQWFATFVGSAFEAQRDRVFAGVVEPQLEIFGYQRGSNSCNQSATRRVSGTRLVRFVPP